MGQSWLLLGSLAARAKILGRKCPAKRFRWVDCSGSHSITYKLKLRWVMACSQGGDEKFKLNASSINQYPPPRHRWSMTGDWRRLKARIEDEYKDEAAPRDEVAVAQPGTGGRQQRVGSTASSWCMFFGIGNRMGVIWGVLRCQRLAFMAWQIFPTMCSEIMKQKSTHSMPILVDIK